MVVGAIVRLRRQYSATMNELERDLARFYDQQAPQRETRPVPVERGHDRRRFVQILRREDRTTVLDIGAGAGHDSAELDAAGLTVVALDLSLANSVLCQRKGVPSMVASTAHLPIRSAAFDAVFTMSTLLHLPDAAFELAIADIVRVVEPGGLIAVGLWGGLDREMVHHDDEFEPKRRYWYRSDESLLRLIESHGVIEHSRTWTGDVEGLHYQFLVVRTPAAQ